MLDATVIFVDMFAIKYDLVVNHTMHGPYLVVQLSVVDF
jgi:hypothetical protein